MIAEFVASLAKRSEESARFAYCLGFASATFFAVQHALTNPFYGQIFETRSSDNRAMPLLECIFWTEVFAFAFIALFLSNARTLGTGKKILGRPKTRTAIIESTVTGVLSLACYAWAQSGLEIYQVAILAGVSPFTYAIVSRTRALVMRQEIVPLPRLYFVAWCGVVSVVAISALLIEDIKSWSLIYVIPALLVPGFFYWGYAAIRNTHERDEIFAGSMVATGIATLVLSLALLVVFVVFQHDFSANEISGLVFSMGAVGTIATAFFAKLTFQAGLYATQKVEDTLSFFMFLIPLLSILIAWMLSKFTPMTELTVDKYKIGMGLAAGAAIYLLHVANKQKEE